jgi:hypothetical protein
MASIKCVQDIDTTGRRQYDACLLITRNSLGWTRNTAPLEGGDLPEDGTLYARKTKSKSQMQYKK